MRVSLRVFKVPLGLFSSLVEKMGSQIGFSGLKTSELV